MADTDDPRFLRSREAITGAARELLLRSGPGAVTHVRVAEVAGVGRATVYRHWPRTDLLLAEAMASTPMPFFDDPTSPIRDWLRDQLVVIARQLELHEVRAVTTTLANAALWDRDMNARRAQFVGVLGDRLTAALDGAVTRGELVPHLQSRSAAALLLGPIYYRSTLEHEPLDADMIEATLAALGRWSAPSHGDQGGMTG